MQRRMRDAVCLLGVGTSRVPLPHVSLFLASCFPGMKILVFVAFRISGHPVKSRPRSETSDAHSVLYTYIPGSDLTPIRGKDVLTSNIHFGMEFMLHFVFRDLDSGP
jgi:hypothetical protein